MRSPDQPSQLRTNPANTGTHLRHNQPCWLQHGDSHPLPSVCTTDGDQTRMNRSEVTLQVPSIFLNLFLYATKLLYLKLRGVLHQQHMQPRSTLKTRKLLILLFLRFYAQHKTPHVLLIPRTTRQMPLAEKPFPCICEEHHGKSQWSNYNFFLLWVSSLRQHQLFRKSYLFSHSKHSWAVPQQCHEGDVSSR